MHRLIYLAGPYRGDTEANIAVARQHALEIAKAGFFPVTPHLNTAHFDRDCPDIPDQFWLEGTLELMDRCDAVYLLPNWEASEGAKAEKENAERYQTHCFDSIAEMKLYFELEDADDFNSIIREAF